MTVYSYINLDEQSHTLHCQGDWVLENIPEIQTQIETFTASKVTVHSIDAAELENLDSAGAWLLFQCIQNLNEKNPVDLKNLSRKHDQLYRIISEKLADESQLKPPKAYGSIALIGVYATQCYFHLLRYLSFLGYLAIERFRLLRNGKGLRWSAIAGIVYRDGFDALGIIALLSFMIGVVLAYQLGLQLRTYGANIYIVDLLGLATLREFGPLITAIMVAGRTGSSFTAQLGMMKINQEIDALNTMGVTPAELLLLPRILGLVIALPLLTMWADIFGILGGMMMSSNMLGISWHDFLDRFPHVVKLKNLLIGLGKAPIFALLIASIGCYQGMEVESSADSVGRNTTKSVVLAIFFIIVADALFSILFSKLKL